MQHWTLERIESITRGRWLKPPEGSSSLLDVVGGFSIDSRTIEPGQAFIALRGERLDGHDYLADSAGRGAALLIVDRPESRLVGAPTLLVDDTLGALQELARRHRDALRDAGTRVIAVTGSNGKTTTRHLIHSVLSGVFRGTQSPKSFNNHIGVPLTLLAASTDDDFVVAEVGTNHPGEIETLAALLRPDAAVITNIGTAHIGLLGSREAIAAEKSAVLRHFGDTGLAVIPADEPLLEGAMRELPLGVQTARFGAAADAHVQCLIIDPQELHQPLTFTVRMGEETFRVQLPLLGEHNATNALAALAVGRWMGLDAAAMTQALASISGVAMRAQMMELNGAAGSLTVINDAYNANPDSVRSALRMLSQTRRHHTGRCVAILGDMFELGDYGPEEHRAVGAELARHDASINLAILIGKLSMFTAESLARQWPQERVRAMPQWHEQLPDEVAALLQPGDLVLLKASRGMALERLIPAMRQRLGAERASANDLRTIRCAHDAAPGKSS